MAQTNTSKKRKSSGSTGGRKASGKSAANKKSAAGKTTAAKKTQNAKKPDEASASKNGIGGEAAVLAIFAVCILLFLGDLGLAGRLGSALRSVQCGLFGSMGYLFPFYLLWVSVFIYANGAKYPRNTFLKIGVSFITFLSLCGLLELLGGNSFGGNYSLTYYYTHGAEVFGGGWFGGLFYLKLYPIFGVLGTYVVLAALVIIGLVFTTGRSLIGPLQERGSRMAERARENARKRHEEEELRREEERLRREEEALARQERRQELEKRRTDLKARSLAFGEETKLDTDWEAESAAASGKPDRESSSPGSGNTPVDSPEQKKVTAEEISSSTEFTGVIHGAEAREEYMPHREKRTLSELEALDRGEDSGKEPMLFGTDAAHEGMLKSSDEPKNHSEEDLSVRITHGMEDETRPSAEAVSFFRSSGEPEVHRAASEEPETASVHPASETFSEEESLAAYDEFKDSPVPADWELELPGHSRRKTEKKDAAESRWRAGDPMDGTAGVNFTPAAPVKPEAPTIQKEYQFPPMELLKVGPKTTGTSEATLKATAVKLQQTLRNFGVGVTVTDISCGPAVTRYELHPDQGVKVSRIVALQDDIKLNLAASDIRIEAPIPGKAAVGIEVPNAENQTVYLKELLDSPEFRKFPSKVSFGVGKDISGKVIVADLARMPHLLIAGATGSGKSVCINSIIMSILYKAHPDDVKLIMIDPKVVELSVYNGIPHLMIPVVTDPKKAAGALNWAVSEMSNRYKRFADEGVRDIKGYNKKVEESGGEELERMPQIVVIVDELADLMMVSANEMEEAICRLAQLARAAGIHLVLATQRPSVNVITGLIKANVPSRIAFAVSSGVDSRTILDMNGAEKLLGKGDMLFYPSGYPKPVRVQGAFVTDGEVAEVVRFLTENDGGATISNQALEQQMEESARDAGTVGAGERDELFVKAGEFLIEKDKASIGNLQRAFRIGFNRAARIMDQLADCGVVGPDEGTKARQILMTREQFQELVDRL
ncbi:MAG: DNA translocase FtsK [Lachnospiraceae bacterium]|nr:DNA translocase FtsK [Lachnospiraceae bacterium]